MYRVDALRLAGRQLGGDKGEVTWGRNAPAATRSPPAVPALGRVRRSRRSLPVWIEESEGAGSDDVDDVDYREDFFDFIG